MSEESQKTQRIAKNTFILYVRMLFTVFISLYTARLVLDKLGAEDYGIYNVVGGVVAMMWMLNGALQSSTTRNITIELGCENFEKLNKVFGNALSIHGLLSFVILLIGETIGLWFVCNQLNIPSDRIIAAQWIYQTSILSMVISVMSVPFNAAIVAYEKMSVYSYISILDVVLKLVVVFALDLGSTDRLVMYSVLMFATQFVVQGCYIIYGLVKLPEITFHFLYDKKIFTSMLAFAGWNLIGSGSALVMTTGHSIILNQFFGPLVNAAKGIADTVLSKAGSLGNSFQMALNPQIYKSYATGNMEYMHKLIFASSKFSYFLIFIISLPIIIEADNILGFWLKEVPKYTIGFVRLLLLTTAVNALCNPQVIAAQATGNIKKFQMVESFTLLSILPFTWMVLKFGLEPLSAFYIYLVIHIVAVLARAIMLRKMINLSLKTYLRYVIFPIIIVTVGTTLVGFVLHELVKPAYFITSLLVCSVLSIITVLSVFFIGLQKNEQNLVKEKIAFVIAKMLNISK